MLYLWTEIWKNLKNEVGRRLQKSFRHVVFMKPKTKNHQSPAVNQSFVVLL